MIVAIVAFLFNPAPIPFIPYPVAACMAFPFLNGISYRIPVPGIPKCARAPCLPIVVLKPLGPTLTEHPLFEKFK